eukprot:scaffold95386_cov33-Phaeocystis_antarctica.AAC.2
MVPRGPSCLEHGSRVSVSSWSAPTPTRRPPGQCSTFTGIGPEAESNHVTLRIKYGIRPAISGIYPNPAAESNLGYIPLFSGTQLWQRRARAANSSCLLVVP